MSTDSEDTAREEGLRAEAATADIPRQDLAQFLTMSDFRVDFTRRRRAVFFVTGYLTIFASVIGLVLLWCIVKNVEKGTPVDPMLMSLMSGIITATFLNIGGIIGGYLIVPSWERSNFRKNTTNIMQAITESRIQAGNIPATPGVKPAVKNPASAGSAG